MSIQYFIALVFFTICLPSSGQQALETSKKENLHVPFFKEYSVKSLTKQLIKKDTSEEQKVRSIFLWISHNIQYDLQLLQKFNEEQEKPGKILFKKKADCIGYTHLFHTMCSEAGVKSMVVPGYEKLMSYTPGDKFYTQSWYWNAVMISGKWMLLDVTLSSGHFVQKKRAFKKFLYHSFKIPYLNNKFTFKKNFSEKYYLTAPSVFVLDHLPVQPMWQLLKCPVTMDLFEDTTGKQSDFLITSLIRKDTCIDFLKQINEYILLPEPEKMKMAAEQAYLFNPRNNRIMGYAYANYGMNLLSDLRSPSLTPSMRKGRFQEGTKYLRSAILYLQKFKNDNSKIHDRNESRNLLRNETITRPNKKFTDANKSILSSLDKEIFNKERKNEKLDVEINKQLEKKPSTISGGPLKVEKVKTDSLKTANEWKQNNDSIYFITTLLTQYDDSISIDGRSFEQNLPKLLDTYKANSIYLKSSIDYNNKLAPLPYIIHNINAMTQLKKEFTTTAKENVVLKRHISNTYSKKESMQKKITQIKKRNLVLASNLYGNHGISHNNTDLSQDNIALENNKVAKLGGEKYFNSLDIARVKEEIKLLEKENDLLKLELQIEDLRFKFFKDKENFRYVVYNKRSDMLILKCNQLIQVPVRF